MRALRPILGALILAMFAAAPLGAADTKLELGVPNATINTTYFLPDHVMMLAAQPRTLLAHPTLANSPAIAMLGSLQTELGFDPRKLDEVVFLVGPRIEREENTVGNEVVGIVLRNSEPFVRDKFAKQLRDSTEASVDGKKYYAAANPWGLSHALPNDRTLVLALETDLKRMLTAKPTRSPLTDAVAKADRRKAAHFVLAVEPLRKLAKLDGANQQQLPPPIDTFLKMAELLDSIDVSIAANDLALEGALRTRTVDEADQLLGFTNSLLGLATGGLDVLADQLKQAPPKQRRDAEPFVKTAKAVLAVVKPKVDKTNVTVQIDGKTMQETAATAIAALAPVLERQQKAAEQMRSTNNLRQILLAMHNYHDTHGAFPGNVADKNGKPLLSWRVAILPMLEQQALYNEFKLDEPWDSAHNKKLAERMPEIFKAHGSKAPAGKTTFLGVKGKGTVFGADKPQRFQDLVDGTSNTVMLVDAADDRAVDWTRPDDLAYDPEKPAAGLVGHLTDKILVGMADGSIRILPAKMDPEMLRRMMTSSDGKPVEIPEDEDAQTFNEVGNVIETRIEDAPAAEVDLTPAEVPAKKPPTKAVAPAPKTPAPKAIRKTEPERKVRAE